MAHLDFKHFTVFSDIRRKQRHTVDAREQFADLIYNKMDGIRAHALALRIFNSKGKSEFSDEDTDIIRRVAEACCRPGFIDGLMEQLENGEAEPIKS